MKIIISSYDEINNPYYGGGGAIAVYNIAKRLSKDHDVTVISGKYPGYSSKSNSRLSYRHIGLTFGGPKFGQLIYQLLLPWYAKSLEFDVWIESFTPPFSTAFLPLFTKKPVIGLAHFLDSLSKSIEYKLPFYLIERIGLKKYQYFIALTKAVKTKIIKSNPRSLVTIIPNGIEIPASSVKWHKQAAHILFLGRIEIYQKGLALLLDSYKQIKNSIDLPLIIAGGGSRKDVDFLKKTIQKFRMGDKVKLVGKIKGEQKKQLLQNAAFIVLPSRSETQPLVALESMSYACPLLVFDIEGFQWLPSAHAVKVKPFDIKVYAEMMKTLAKDVGLRRKLSNNAKKFVQAFDWDLLVKDYATFIEKVIALHKRRK